jgi:cytochrome d ubiquinol oxidase subunit II
MLTLGEVLALVMLVALIAYALTAGADFGAGVWDLLASGPRTDRQRDVIARAIGPIWEANHVWLIIVVVVMFTAFPSAFAIVMTALHVPIAVMLLGIVLRGSSFVFRTYDSSDSAVRGRWGRIFAISSVFTPVLLGIVIGAISTGTIEVEDGVVVSGFFRSWLGFFPLSVGLFALAQFSFLAATYLTVDAEEDDLREDYRRRALAAAAAVALLAMMTGFLARIEAPLVARGLFGHWWSWPLQLATGCSAVGAIAALWRRWYRLARVLAATQVACILGGWGLMMNPYLIAGELTVADAAAPPVTLRLLLIILAAGGLILFPALWYLLRTFKGGVIFAPLDRTEDAGDGDA